jgi:smad nuclear-interacting protein 1
MPGEKQHQRSYGRSRSRSRDRRRSRSDSRDRRRRGGSDRAERRAPRHAAEEARRSDAASTAGASSSSAKRRDGSPRRHHEVSRGDSRDRASHRSRPEHRRSSDAASAQSARGDTDKDVWRRSTGTADQRSEVRSEQNKADAKSRAEASDSRSTAATSAKAVAVDAKDSERSVASRTASSRHELPPANTTHTDKEEPAAAAAAAAAAEEEVVDEEPQYKQAANFGLSGALAKDVGTGNLYKGILLKWSEPADARAPTKKWRLYVFKGDQVMQTLYIHRQSAYLVGRERKIADIPVDHPSCSKQHAVIQFRQKEVVQEAEMQTIRSVRPYIMDLER